MSGIVTYSDLITRLGPVGCPNRCFVARNTGVLGGGGIIQLMLGPNYDGQILVPPDTEVEGRIVVIAAGYEDGGSTLRWQSTTYQVSCNRTGSGTLADFRADSIGDQSSDGAFDCGISIFAQDTPVSIGITVQVNGPNPIVGSFNAFLNMNYLLSI